MRAVKNAQGRLIPRLLRCARNDINWEWGQGQSTRFVPEERRPRKPPDRQNRGQAPHRVSRSGICGINWGQAPQWDLRDKPAGVNDLTMQAALSPAYAGVNDA